MPLTVIITLSNAGNDTGPFNLYSNKDGFLNAFEINVPKSTLQNGFTSTTVPMNTNKIRVKSIDECENFVDLDVPQPILDLNKTYVYSSCTQNFTLATQISGNNEEIGDITRYIKNNNPECWKLIQVLNSWQPSYPANLVVSNYFNTYQITGSYEICDDCINPTTFTLTKGNLLLTTNDDSFLISNSNYVLTVNSNNISNTTSIIGGSNPTITLSNINNSQIINPVFTKVEIFDSITNVSIYSKNINNTTSFTFSDFQMPTNNVRLDVSVTASNIIG